MVTAKDEYMGMTLARHKAPECEDDKIWKKQV